MKKKSQKTVSALLSSLMAISVISAAPISVQAKEKVDSQKQQAMDEIKQLYRQKLSKLGDNKGKLRVENDNLPKDNKVNREEKVRIIVELNEKSLKDYAPKTKSLSEAAKDINLMNKIEKSKMPLKAQVKSINNKIVLKKDYSVLLNGFSVEVQYKDIEKIKELAGVKHVTIVKKYYPDMNNAKKLTNAENVWKDYGYKGEGLVVSIIDTGIDVEHKDMNLTDISKAKFTKAKIADIKEGKGKFYTDKVIYGYNFADDNEVIKDTTSSMHGMHVAGIVGANCKSEEEIKNNQGIKGVAPEAQLFAMKVFSNDPANKGAFADDIVAAIEDSVVHAADVINMSLGSTAAFQDPEDAEQVAIKEATDRGTMVVVSAGNSQYSTAPLKIPGVNDTGLVGSPGLAEDTIQVASFENTNTVSLALEFNIGEEKGQIPYTTSELSPVGVLNGEYEAVDCGLGRGACDEKKAGNDFVGKDLKGKIALIQRGGNTFIEKKQNAQAAGAIGAIVYNKNGDDSFINMATDPSVKIPGIFVRYSDGAKLKTGIAKGLKVKFGNLAAKVDNINNNDMSDFTSWGPTPNLDFKPEITAPGGQIWSTVNDNKYENMSGTSMSSPHTAGSMALVMQHVNKLQAENRVKLNTPREKAEFAKKLAVNTTKIMMDKNYKELPYSPRRQGAGMIDTKAAVENNVTVEYKENGKAVVALKEIGSQKEFTLKLHNYGKETVTYDVTPLNDKVLTETNKFLKKEMSYDMKMEDSNVKVNKNNITVEAGKDAEVTVTLTIGEKQDKDVFAEGFIRFKSKDNKVPEIGAPYMGFYGKWDAMNAVDAPMWSEETLIGKTTLLTKSEDGKIYYLGQVGTDDRDDPIVEEGHIAISNSGEKGVNENVLPLMYPFRNIKTMKVQVLNEKGEVVREIYTEKDMRKVVISDPHEAGHRLSEDWLWDGKIYNKNTGKFEAAPDGKYTMRLASDIDYKGAKTQNTDMKVKVDSEEPQIDTDFFIKEKPGDICTLKFKANDGDGSGIQIFAFFVNGKLYQDENGEKIFTDLKKDSEGFYNFDMKIPGGKDINMINIAAVDYAGNLGASMSISMKKGIDASFKQDDKVPESGIFKPGDIQMTYRLLDEYKNQVNLVDVYMDNVRVAGVKAEPDTKDYSYTFKDVKAGDHEITLKGIKAEGEKKETVLESKVYKVKVEEDTGFKLKFSNLEAGMIVNTSSYEIQGTVSEKPSKFTINGEDVEVNGVNFNHIIKLVPGAVNKVKVYLEAGDKKLNYAYNVKSDITAPEINIDVNKNAVEKDNQVLVTVPKDTENYTLKGMVKDDLYGYRFFINGENVHNVELEIPNEKSAIYNFQKEYKLTANTTIINLRAVDMAGNETTKVVKIVKDIPNPGQLKIERINIKSSYMLGEQFNGGIKVTNTTSEAKSATLIVGVFNDQNQMVNVGLVNQLVGAGVSTELSTMLMIPQEGNYTIRCFVWDSLNSMLPLSEVVQVPVIPSNVENAEAPKQNIKSIGETVQPK